MKTKKSIITFLCILLLCIIIVIITQILTTNDIKNTQYNKYNEISDRYITNLNQKIIDYLKYIDFGINFMSLFSIYNSTIQNFIDLSVLKNNELDNELRIHYFVQAENRINFTTRLSQNLNKNIDIITENKTVISQYSYYCPITYISPNTSLTAYNFIGLDICHVNVFTKLIKELNTTTDVVVLTRQSIISNNVILDIAKKSDIGISTLSITLIDLLSNINKQISVFDINHIIYYKNISVYNSCKPSNCTEIPYKRKLYFGNNIEYNIEIYYNNESIINIVSLIIGMVMILILFISVIILYLFYRNEKKVESLKKYQFASDMLGYVNHEIRNPLNSIQGLINISIFDLQQLLNFNSDLNLVISNLSTAENSCELLNHIVNDILDIKKIQENKLKIDYKPLSLKAFEKDLYKTILLKLHEKPFIKYTYHIQEGLDIIITDRHRLLQIMINFITNALKFTESGSISVNIKRDEFNYIIFSVKDTGRGISESKKNLIFQPYSQVEIMDSLRGSGVGLGLHLCKMIIECFDGKIGFFSKEGTGSTFFIKLKNIDENNIIDTL
jgi:signal transduction histidine kinase